MNIEEAKQAIVDLYDGSMYGKHRGEFICRCITPDVEETIAELAGGCSDARELFEAVRNCDALKLSMFYGEIGRDRFWDIPVFANTVGGCDVDSGGIAIGGDDFSIIIPNGYGDCYTRVYVCAENDFNKDMAHFFTSCEGKFELFGRELEGRYGIYYYSGSIFFVRWN